MSASTVDNAAPTTTAPARADATAWVWRVRHGVVALVFLAFALNTDPGKLVNDTKLDLVVRPMALLQRALHLWDPLGSAGQLQNQAYGYLFPMGPFFAVAHAIHVPGWVTQRMWWGLLLTVSYAGFVLLARRLRIGTEWTRLVAGVGFALAPHVLTVLGRSSVEAWPPALAPWVLVPLVGVGAGGRPRRAAALSGLAVLAMGGVNAAVDLAAVLPAVLWLLTRRWSLAWLRLVLWWVAAAFAATLWWVVPLLTLGRFSPPFLDFIESASYTTSTTTLVETLRGTADWVAYLGDAGSRAGYALLTQPLLILMTVLLVALGLVGVASRRTHERAWLALMLVAGVALVTAGHVGPVDGPFAEEIRSALDGALAPLRNVHKFDVLVRTPIFLGMASTLALLSEGRNAVETRFLRPVVAAAGAFVVVGASTPFFGLGVSPTGAYDGVPDYWSQAATWLDEHGGTGRTLLLPGSRFAQYNWGATGDEPIQALATTPWDIRNAVPLTSAGHIRWLDSIEQSVASGRGGPDLERALTSGGVSYLLVRNDLSYGAAGATRLATVRATLSSTPGVSLAASFGPLSGGGSTPDSFSDGGLNLALPSIEVYGVADGSDPRVTMVPAKDVSRVVGGSEAMALAGMDGADPFIRDATPGLVADVGGPVVLTDTPRRREANFGVGTFGSSQTLTASDPLRIVKPTRDYGYSGDEPGESVAVIGGVRAISASSSAADADAYPRSDPGSMPFAAFDGDLGTQWRPNPIKPVSGSWISVDFGRPVSLGGGRVTLDLGTSVTRLGVVTDRGPTSVPVVDDVAVLPDVTTTSLTLSLRDLTDDPARRVDAAIRDVDVPGVTVTRTVRLPQVPGGEEPDRVVLSADIGHGACTFLGPRPLCDPGTGRVGEDAAGLDRTFTLSHGTDAIVAVSARARPSAALQGAVERALGLAVHATSSSTAVPDLVAGPMAAVDGNLGTAWVASAGDPDPSLTLAWSRTASVAGIQVLLDNYVAATRPTHVRITSPAGTRDVDLDASGRATFTPLATTTMTVHFTAPALATSLDAYTFRRTFVGLGVTDLRIPGLTPDLAVPERPSEEPVTFPCGAGPTVRVDGESFATSVSTTVGAVLAQASVPARVCEPGAEWSGPVRVALPAGDVHIVAPRGPQWLTSSVVVTAAGSGVPPMTGEAYAPAVTAWGDRDRTLSVGERTAPALLVIHENVNPGWRASFAGHDLTPVTVNGWQQGYLVPAGAAGSVQITFVPDAQFRWGILAGGGLAVLLILAAALPERTRRNRPVGSAGVGASRVVVLVGLVALVVVAGWWGVAVAIAGLAVALVGRRFPHGARQLWPLVAAAGYGAAGAVLLTSPYGSGSYVADQPLAQILCVTAVGAVALSLWTPAPGGMSAADPNPTGGAGEPT